MKTKSILWCAILGILIPVLMIFLILSSPNESQISQLNDQNLISISGSYMAATSISKGTVLLLLLVGVIGLLGVGRKKRGN